MIPELFTIGPVTIYSYGLMLGIAFITASWLMAKEYKRRGLASATATDITFLAILFGLIGAKLFHLFNYWGDFLENPLEQAFSPGGLTFHGGLILAVVAVYIYLRRKGYSFFYVADGTVPALALGYAIGRIGCHLSGDGDYGIPTDLPWGVNYENGVVPPSYAFLNTPWADNYPNGFVPDSTPLHPTPIYEAIAAFIIFLILWRLRKTVKPDGVLFFLFFILYGVERFLVEFIRINPRIFYGLTEAQIVSAALIIIGFLGIAYVKKNVDKFAFTPPPVTEKE